MIDHDNIIYISYISEIGGVETFAYELAKKYKDRDVAVVCREIDQKQLQRLSKICWVYKFTGQKIKCKTAIINYDISIIPYICEEAKIYQTIHADYEHEFYKKKFPQHDRIYKYIGITKHIVESFKRNTGKNNIILGYNPLTIDTDKKYLQLISATRLSAIKGKKRMEALCSALDRAGIDYIWYVFTNDINAIKSPNVIYMKPRLDISKWLEKSDYLVQLSDTEACSYSINEALYRNIPVIVTPLPYLEEIGYKDGKTGYTLEFDCSNLNEIVKKILNIPSFSFTQLKDIYGELFTNSESYYKEENMKVKIRCIVPYWDIKLNPTEKKNQEKGAEWIVDKDRADYLIGLGLVELVEYVVEKPTEKPKAEENKKVPTKKVNKR